MKRLFFLLTFLSLLLTASAAQAQFSQTEINYLKTIMSQWIAAGSTIGGSAGHTIQEDGTPLTARSVLNFTGTGITCSDSGGVTVCDVPAGTVDQSASYAWTGTNSWVSNKWSLLDSVDNSKVAVFSLSGISAKTTRTYTLPDANTTLVGTANANTWSTGAQDMGSATSFKIPTAAGAGPTASGLIAYDSTSDTLEWGANGSNKIALADPGANGMTSRTASGATTARTISPVSNEIAITNGNGVSGNPTIGLGALAVQTGKANTFTTGDQDFGNATSLQVKRAAGYAPTTASYFGYNSTTNKFVGGNGTAAKIFAFSDEVQPLASNLTAFANLTNTNNVIAVFNGTTMLGTGLPTCVDSGGNHLNYDTATHTWSCGTSGTGGLSGATTGKYLIATGATAFDGTTGNLTESGGVVNAGGGLTVGNVSANKLSIDPTAVTGTKAWTVQNIAGIPLVATTEGGAITDTNMAIFKTTGGITRIVDGGAVGTGTWTDASKNTGSNKELVATEAGGTNTITVPVRAFWDAASLTLPSGSTCTLGAVAAINSGPSVAAVNCTDAGTSTFEGEITLPQTIATVTFTITVNDVNTGGEHFSGNFSAMCRNNGTTVNNTWGTDQLVDITMTTVNINYTGTTAAVTPNGTCTAGASLFWRFVVDAAGAHNDASPNFARVLGVLLKQAS